MSPGTVGSKQWIVGAWGGLEALLNGESDKWLGEGILCWYYITCVSMYIYIITYIYININIYTYYMYMIIVKNKKTTYCNSIYRRIFEVAGKENLDLFERRVWDGGIHGRLGIRLVTRILGKT